MTGSTLVRRYVYIVGFYAIVYIIIHILRRNAIHPQGRAVFPPNVDLYPNGRIKRIGIR